MNSKACGAEERDALGDQALKLDAFHLRAVLLALSGALRVLIALELALDALAGAVEEIDRRPEQIFEIGFQPRVAEHLEHGVEHRSQRRLNDRLLGEWTRVWFVLESAMAVDLHLVDEAAGRGGRVVGLEGVVEGQGKIHDDLRRFGPRLSRPDGDPCPCGGGPEPRAQRSGPAERRAAEGGFLVPRGMPGCEAARQGKKPD